MRMAREFFFPIRRNQVNFWSTSNKAEKKKRKEKKGRSVHKMTIIFDS